MTVARRSPSLLHGPSVFTSFDGRWRGGRILSGPCTGEEAAAYMAIGYREAGAPGVRGPSGRCTQLAGGLRGASRARALIALTLGAASHAEVQARLQESMTCPP